jgi:hypothetical protein
MRRKLKTKAGKAVYATRKAIVEPVFGQIKQARGFRQFLLRGIEKVRGEWALLCLTHNILKCYRLSYEQGAFNKSLHPYLLVQIAALGPRSDVSQAHLQHQPRCTVVFVVSPSHQ